MIAIKVRIMPASPDTDLEKINKEAEKKIMQLGATLHNGDKEDIAFGLKALILVVAWPEEKSPDELETSLSGIGEVESAKIIDVRRAAG